MGQQGCRAAGPRHQQGSAEHIRSGSQFVSCEILATNTKRCVIQRALVHRHILFVFLYGSQLQPAVHSLVTTCYGRSCAVHPVVPQSGFRLSVDAKRIEKARSYVHVGGPASVHPLSQIRTSCRQRFELINRGSIDDGEVNRSATCQRDKEGIQGKACCIPRNVLQPHNGWPGLP